MFLFSILGGRMNYEYPVDYGEDVQNKPQINGHELVSGNNKDMDLEIQHQLDDDQLNAVNSGITSLKVQAYDNLENTKQDKLDDTQLQVLQSGITAAKLNSIFNFNFLKEVEGYDSSKTQILKNVNGTIKWVSE